MHADGRILATMLSMLLLLPALPLGAAADEAGYDGRACLYQYAPVAGDAAAVRRRVPAGFDIAGEQAGQAVLFVITVACETFGVGGARGGRVAFSDVGVTLVPPGLEPGIHLYWLWDLTDSRALHALAAGAGIAPSELVELRVNAAEGVPLTTTHAAVPWSQGAYDLAGTFAGGQHHAFDGTVVWWHATRSGTVRLDQTFHHDGAHGETTGAAVLHARGTLAGLIGSENVVEANLAFANLTATLRFA